MLSPKSVSDEEASKHGSRSPSPESKHGSRSPSPESKHGSRSPSPASKHGSRSPSPASKHGSRSPSPASKHGSRSPSPASKHGSRSPSPASKHGSRSPSPASNHGSRSPSPASKHGSRSPSRSPQTLKRKERKSSDSESSGRDTPKKNEDEEDSDGSIIKVKSLNTGQRHEIPKDLISSDSDSESDVGKNKKKPIFIDSPKSDEEKSKHGSRSPTPQPVEKEERKSSDSESEGERSPKTEEPEVKVEEEEPPPETRIDVEIPKITTDLGRGIHFVKLPNFLSVETRPFDSNTYEDEIDDEETLDEEGRARLKLKVENTIRWRERFNDKGVFVKESNARFVRWSDGSLSLHLGDEIFNVEKQTLAGDHNHLFIRQGTGLQGQAVFRTKLTFRPHSTESFTHRKMTMSLADRSTKTQGIKVLSIVGSNPEANRFEMIKKEEDKLRASLRRENKQRRVRERTSLGKGLSSSYLDDEYSDDDNSISIAAIKNKYKKGGSRTHIYSSSDDDASDVERGRKLEKAKRLKDSDEDDDEKSGEDTKSGVAGVVAGAVDAVEQPTSSSSPSHRMDTSE